MHQHLIQKVRSTSILHIEQDCSGRYFSIANDVIRNKIFCINLIAKDGFLEYMPALQYYPTLYL